MPDGAPTATHATEATHKQQPAAPVQQKPVALFDEAQPLTLSVQRTAADPGRLTAVDVLALQRTVGNRAVSQLLANAAPRPSHPTIQPKLTVGPVGDRYEQEADRVAEQVMRMGKPANLQMGTGVQRQAEEEQVQARPLAATITPLVQRQEEEELQAKPLVQRQEEEEEELRAKPLIQRQEEEEEVQAQPLIQRQPEEEEELQTKPLIQRQPEEEEELQTKPLIQRQAEEEEELQTKPLVQRQAEEEEELQTKPLPSTALRTGVQRQAGEEEELQAKPLVQRRADGGFEAGPEMESRLAAHQGRGRPLPGDVRAFMEPRFGADFGGVRVHADGAAAQLNRKVQAQAFTHGNDIYFNEGQYSPHTKAGKELLAHELTHTIQQTGAVARAVQRVKLPKTSLKPGDMPAEEHGATLLVMDPILAAYGEQKGSLFGARAGSAEQRRFEFQVELDEKQIVAAVYSVLRRAILGGKYDKHFQIVFSLQNPDIKRKLDASHKTIHTSLVDWGNMVQHPVRFVIEEGSMDAGAFKLENGFPNISVGPMALLNRAMALFTMKLIEGGAFKSLRKLTDAEALLKKAQKIVGGNIKNFFKVYSDTAATVLSHELTHAYLHMKGNMLVRPVEEIKDQGWRHEDLPTSFNEGSAWSLNEALQLSKLIKSKDVIAGVVKSVLGGAPYSVDPDTLTTILATTLSRNAKVRKGYINAMVSGGLPAAMQYVFPNAPEALPQEVH